MPNSHHRVADRRGRLRRWLTTCLLAMVVFPTVRPAGVRAASGVPSLVFVTRPGHSLAVAGKNWGRHIVLTAQIGDSVGGVVVGSISGGRFTVALDFSVACGGVTVVGRDYRGDEVTIRRAGPLCPNRAGEPPASASIIQGLRNTPRVRILRHPHVPRTLTLRLGDELLVTEPGGLTPSFLPAADPPHFEMFGHGVQGSAVCTQAPCLQVGDQYWTWIAVKRGNASLNLSPACRLSRPPCELAEAVIDITIRA